MFADNWCLKSNERVYGPYSSRDLKKFAQEGRFAAWSLVAPAGGRDFKEARLEPAFAQLFGIEKAPDGSHNFGKLDRSDAAPATPANDISHEPRRARPLGSAKPNPSTDQLEPANFVIIFDVVNAAASRVENALSGLGSSFRLAENVWSVNCALTAIGVRNALSPFLRPYESLFVIDATHGRTSWQNYAPEAHAKITKAYVHGRLG
ncbi:MAG: hypothetical protein AAB227_11340 [Pseudomonadota bacterium]